MRGRVRMFEPTRGFGFAETPERRDIYFNQKAVDPLDLAGLRTGSEIEFELITTADNRLRAVNVRVVVSATASPAARRAAQLPVLARGSWPT